MARRSCVWPGRSPGPPSSSPPQAFCDPVPWRSTSSEATRIGAGVTFVPQPPALDITCSQNVCPGVGTPCVLLWVPCDLVPCCMIFSEVMHGGGTFVSGPPFWEVTFSRLMCSCVGVRRMARQAGLGVTFPFLPAGAAGLVGPVCWAASPGPPRVWLVGKGGQAER